MTTTTKCNICKTNDAEMQIDISDKVRNVIYICKECINKAGA